TGFSFDSARRRLSIIVKKEQIEKVLQEFLKETQECPATLKIRRLIRKTTLIVKVNNAISRESFMPLDDCIFRLIAT
ncbi:MAG: hypothetical protein NO474_03200, partial [Methanomassiliicoccales archaeon]|nr:hypothetical protein [Methanomassiliicoccales archaeon]